MKNRKFTALLLAGCMIASFAGCQNSNQTTNDSPTPTETVVATKAPDVATNTPVSEPTVTPEPTATPTPAGPDGTYTTNYEYTVGKYAPAETLSDRALIAVTTSEGVLVSWRYFEGENIEYTLTRDGKEIYKGTTTNFLDKDGKAANKYVLTYTKGTDAVYKEETTSWNKEYQEFTLKQPANQKMPSNHMSVHEANDMSVGDLDGDGQLELIVKWYPDDAQDNSKDGWTGTTILDAYDLDIATGEATLMWRIDLGLNIRSGAHYTQFQVWDYDGDGCAEIICKTADGTTTYNGNLEETGYVGACSMASLDTNKNKRQQDYDWRNTANGIGRVFNGQEYLTAFNGKTGEIIDTVEYIPLREDADHPAKSWGDEYGNRNDRYLAGTAYIDDGTAAAIMCRGYYARTSLTAWKLIDGKLTLAWYFDCPMDAPYAAQGNHGLSINDVDGDGYDEIIYGSLIMDNDGKVLNCTGLGHGDAMHVSDWNADGKLEVFQVHEHTGAEYQIELHDAATGEILWGVHTGKDTGRGMAADIDPRYKGAEMWAAANGNTFDSQGNIIYENIRPSINFSIFWDGDLLMELFDYTSDGFTPCVTKWDWEKQKAVPILTANGCSTSNGTKGNAGLIADIYGDWREEIIVRDAKNYNKIRIYSTPYATEYNVPCLLTDRAYREGVAWQNTAYNQPANLTRLLSEELYK